MSDPSGHHQSGAADEAILFRDEIFNWPIARLNNVDVWELILKKYVTHPTDQNNLIVTSPQFFGSLLKDKKCSNLFGEVLDILHRRHYLALSKSEFLHFRGLSKTCKTSIDTVVRINNHCVLHHTGIEHDTSDPKHVCWNRRCFPYLLDLQPLFKKHSNMNLEAGLVQFGGALPGLSIGFGDMQIYPNLQALLSPIGTQIYHLHTSIQWDSRSWREQYLFLHTLVGVMPNLVSLQIVGKSYVTGDKDKEWLMELCRCIEENPLASLNSLIYLKIDGTAMEVTNALYAKYAEKLEKLSMTFAEPTINAFLHSSDHFSKANVLTDLHIYEIPDDFSRSLSQNPKWPTSLRNVCLLLGQEEFKRNRQNFQPFCNALLEQLAGANHRIRSLSISIEADYHCHRDDRLAPIEFRIRLPHLRRLWICSSLLSINNIDFILGASDSLDELVLTLSWTAPMQESADEIIRFKGYWHKMYESNIWEKMPRLRRLKIRSLQFIPVQFVLVEYYRNVSCEYEYFRTIPSHITGTEASDEIL